MDLLNYIDQDTMACFYENITTFRPFEDEKDDRTEYGVRLRDKTYYICGNDGGSEISVYAETDGNVYKKIGYAQYEQEKHNNKKCMKLWYLTVDERYQRLGLATMLIAGVKHECQLARVDTLILDAARRYKLKDEAYYRAYPDQEENDRSFYNANLLMYQAQGFEIDKESADYAEGMEDMYLTSPIPMICKLDNIVIPESAQAQSRGLIEETGFVQ